MNIGKPKRLLEFVTLPQGIMALLLAPAFVQQNELASPQLIVVFALQALLNAAVVIYWARVRTRESVETKALYAFLACFLAVFSFGIFSVFEQFTSPTVISPQTLHIICSAVPMLYLSAAAISRIDRLNLPAVIMLCLALPVALAFLSQNSWSFGDLSLILAVGLLCVLIFLLGALGYFLYRKSAKAKNPENTDAPVKHSARYRALVFVAAVVLPQVGLAVNNFMFWGGVLGDFTSIWFYIIAAANGLLLLADTDKAPLPLLYLKSAGFAFIAYFTLIFIPYMPYAIIGIIFYGLGLLVYVPITVFVIQIKQLIRDFKLIKNNLKYAAAIAGFLTLPAIVAINFSIDRANFNIAMTYVNPDRSATQEVNISRLGRSVNEMENSMESTRQRDGLAFAQGTPIISTMYRYIALDNNFFTEDAVTKLRKIFMPETVVSISETMRSEPEPNTNFSTRVSVGEAVYDSEAQVYRAWVDLEVTRLNGPREYRTEFTLPDGCFITDYYLYVGSEKKRGIMTDRRAAQTAYENIIRTPKDPGIIYYSNDDTVTLRVFPFGDNEVRKTGFQIMYSQNEDLTIDGQVFSLAAENPVSEPILMEGIRFIPAEYKDTLPIMERTPQYYFLLDAGDSSMYQRHLALAKCFAQERGIEAKYYAVSYQAKETDPDSTYPSVIAYGGFNTAYAMDEIFSSVPDGRFPVMLLVTDNMNRAVSLEKTRLAKAFPELGCYYRLNGDLTLTPYDFHDALPLPEVAEPSFSHALNYDGIAVSGDGKSETVFTGASRAGYTPNEYENAFLLQGNAYLADTDEELVSVIREAISLRVLTDNTAFMVMETKEQEDMLLNLQERFLSGADIETPSVMMSEPGWALLFVLFVLFVLLCSLCSLNRPLQHK